MDIRHMYKTSLSPIQYLGTLEEEGKGGIEAPPFDSPLSRNKPSEPCYRLPLPSLRAIVVFAEHQPAEFLLVDFPLPSVLPVCVL